jgi:transposase
VLCWHLISKGEDYAYGRPSLLAQKLRALELRAGMPSRRGQRGATHAYNLKEVRARERALSEQGEIAYKQLVADWQAKTPAKKTGTGAASGVRL